VQRVPVLPEANYEVCESSQTHRSLMAFCGMGNRHRRRSSKGSRRFQVLIRRHRHITKWMEATPVVNITQEAAVKILQSIIYRFGVPQRVLTDNGTQFKGAKFLRCYADFGIHHQPSSAAHPQRNGQVERTNGLLLQGIKTRMFQDLEAKDKN
jgi:transposase InsO family protein